MGGALNDARHRVKKTVAGRYRRIVPRGGIHSPGVHVAVRPAPCSHPSHRPGTNDPRITRLASRGRADTTACLLVIK
ncbi:hypothetical protein DF157_24920 [Burkholderia cenocepacia]|nr:hypothetical protein DF157_24920 [Burkholderia cenocepacia]RQV16407.1 hypothetical protein DF030_31240 [Burkholderia cenocepacia]RQV34122.1 hypothetical protein DF028_29150 [Burkholderia cenocepacia]RQV38563.1 hypothetical protein DF027_22520 [Burkholderia cenocepacia]RQV72117.1 hypothetical protein DF010_26085 [Burkholderia cenocepacia]